jgi:hypothetical protein
MEPSSRAALWVSCHGVGQAGALYWRAKCGLFKRLFSLGMYPDVVFLERQNMLESHEIIVESVSTRIV